MMKGCKKAVEKRFCSVRRTTNNNGP